MTLIGAGNAGSACAFMAAEAGHKVTLLKTLNHITHDEHFDAMVKNKGVYCVDNTKNRHFTDSAADAVKTFQSLALITRDPKKAIEGTYIVIIFIQTTSQKKLAKRIAPYFEKNQLVILIPGYVGNIVYNKYCENKPIFSEGESTPNDAIVSEPGTVKVLFKNARNSLSFFPANKTSQDMPIAANLFLAYNIEKKNVRKHIFELALHTPNIIVHTIGLHVMYPMLEYCAKHYPNEVPYIYRDALSKDTAWLMIEKLYAEKLGINMPECKSLIEMCGGILSRDFFKEGRTLTSLGLGDLTKEELLNLIEQDNPHMAYEAIGIS